MNFIYFVCFFNILVFKKERNPAKNFPEILPVCEFKTETAFQDTLDKSI
jgi:hypothetical protein